MLLVPTLLTVLACFFIVQQLLFFKPTIKERGPHHIQASTHNITYVIWMATACLWGVSLLFEMKLLLPPGVALPLLPLLYQRIRQKHFRKSMHGQMDSMLASLSNAVSVSGNLYNAIEDVTDGEPEPMQSELKRVIHEIRLGLTEDEALQHLADRSGLPLFRTAITAIIVGKNSGGDLGHILSETAASIRELKRLEGVLQSKTADARTQAWVMGAMPFALCGILELVSPDWLTPIWTTPFGWFLLGCAGVMELAAVILIRKILKVAL